MQVYVPTTSHSEENIHNFYNDVDETLGKPNQYTIVMGDFSVQIVKMAENGDTKQRLEYAEIYKTIKKKATEDIRKYSQ